MVLGYDADHAVEGPHFLISVFLEEQSLDVLRTKSQRSCGGVQREGQYRGLDPSYRGLRGVPPGRRVMVTHLFRH